MIFAASPNGKKHSDHTPSNCRIHFHRIRNSSSQNIHFSNFLSCFLPFNHSLSKFTAQNFVAIRKWHQNRKRLENALPAFLCFFFFLEEATLKFVFHPVSMYFSGDLLFSSSKPSICYFLHNWFFYLDFFFLNCTLYIGWTNAALSF